MSNVMNIGLFLILIAMTSSPFIIEIPTAFAQTTVDVVETTPCFMDYTSSNMWEDCGMEDNFIKATLMPFEWILGGYFALVVVSILIVITYIKYQTVIYPLMIGIIMLPVSYFAFPGMVISYGIVLAAVGLTAIIKEIVFDRMRN